MRSDGDILLVSTYELGHPPLHLASPVAFLERAGYRPRAVDAAVEPLDEAVLARARFVGVAVPMHTALRLGAEIGARAKALNPSVHLCYFGLYAPLNEAHLRAHGADSVIGGEYEAALVTHVRSAEAAWTERRAPAAAGTGDGDTAHVVASQRGMVEPLTAPVAPVVLERLDFPVPERTQLPPLARYAHLEIAGESRPAGYVEASRGCLHHCRHCPIPPVYGGRFFVVPVDVVLADVAQQVAAGARHVTLGDPDFLNGPGHAMAVARALHQRFPGVTFDVTIKIEHILRRRTLFAELAHLGCAFVVSAVESTSDRVLALLDKGHTRADLDEALSILDDAGIPLRPTWLPFTPWTTLADYLDMLEWISTRGMVEHVDPVQLAVRLLIPPGSKLLELPETQAVLGPLEPEKLSYAWTHPDPRMDRLAHDVFQRVADGGGFAEVQALARAAAALPANAVSTIEHQRVRGRPPRLSESWFC